MLAPGALAVLQAISSYGSSMRIIEQNLAQAAQLAASEEVNMISASREILTSLAAQPDVRAGTGPACRRALAARDRRTRSIRRRAGRRTRRASSPAPPGRCRRSSRSTTACGSATSWRGDGFVVSDLIVSRWLGSWGIVTAVPLVDEQGVIQGSVALFIGLDWLTRRYQRGARSEDDAAFALLDSQRRDHHARREPLAGEVAAAAQTA